MKVHKSIRIEESLVASIEAIADKELRSFNNQLEYLLMQAIDAPKSALSKKVAVKSSAFIIPAIEDVAAYIAEKGYSFDAEAFVSHYEANGWKVGRNKMKSWKAACTTWAKRDNKPDRKPFLTANEKMAKSLRDSRDPIKAMDF